ncbi:MAG: Maf family protein [Patescibacteria group bacterium]
MQTPTLILASASIGRKGLLTKLGIPFEIIPSSINEDDILHQNPYKLLQKRARAKAENVLSQLTHNPQPTSHNFLIVAADSEAVLDGKTYGKAKDREDAKRIVKALMGKTHEFATATCIIQLSCHPEHSEGSSEAKKHTVSDLDSSPSAQNDQRCKEQARCEDLTKTRVTTQKMSDSEINQYVTRYDFTRFAAAYALTETPWDWVTKIDGSYTNVVGLPFKILLPILRKFKIIF